MTTLAVTDDSLLERMYDSLQSDYAGKPVDSSPEAFIRCVRLCVEGKQPLLHDTDLPIGTFDGTFREILKKLSPNQSKELLLLAVAGAALELSSESKFEGTGDCFVDLIRAIKNHSSLQGVDLNEGHKVSERLNDLASKIEQAASAKVSEVGLDIDPEGVIESLYNAGIFRSFAQELRDSRGSLSLPTLPEE